MLSTDIKIETKMASLYVKTKIICIKPSSIDSNKERFDELCRVSCKNYKNKWCCPPFSPEFSDYSREYSELLVCLMSINLNQLNYIKNDYLKVKAANIIMKSRVDRVLREMAIFGNGKMISTGSCRMCMPCRLKNEEDCRYPEKMGYSFEALGVNVGKLSIELFSHKLLWYKKGQLPEYTSVVAGVLLNSRVTEHELMVPFQVLEIK